jgi:hypothetical protein
MSISATETEGRTCGPCVSCCCFFTIAELAKPAGQLCRHSTDQGCEIYAERPNACRVFHCGWRSWAEVPDGWRPDRTGFVLGGALVAGRYLAVTADPRRPEAWRDPAYYPTLMGWACRAAEIGSHVVVFIEKRVIVLRPDGERDLGVIAPDEVLVADERGAITKIQRTTR